MKTNHTPGYWHAEVDTRFGMLKATIYASEQITSAIMNIEGHVGNNIAANAKLIASAPEMLDTLHQIFTDASTPDYIKALVLPVLKTASGDNELKMPVRQATHVQQFEGKEELIDALGDMTELDVYCLDVLTGNGAKVAEQMMEKAKSVLSFHRELANKAEQVTQTIPSVPHTRHMLADVEKRLNDTKLQALVGLPPQFSTTGILDVPADQIPASLYDVLHNNKMWTYEDKMLAEHIFSIDEMMEGEHGVNWNLEQKSVLTAIEDVCRKKNCGYFRIPSI